MSLTESEYTVLRRTIGSRGTARMVLLPVTIIGWAAIAWLTLSRDEPMGSLFPLAVLAGGFEAIHALHVGVERIGRYLQVFYEGTPGGPWWETTATTVGPALPGGGVDPLFTVLFALAVLVNMLAGLWTSASGLQVVLIGGLHAALFVRLLRARGAATRQRAVDLESYRAVRTRLSGDGS